MSLLNRMALVSRLLTSFALASDGSVEGTVTDLTGAVIPNVTILVKNLQTGKTSEVKSGPTGRFGPISSPRGEYKVQIRMRCFKFYWKVVKVEEGQSLDMRIALQPSCRMDLTGK